MPLIERYFAGKTAAISGAGDGIGRALSQRLNAAGCHLWLSDINPETLAETCALLDDSRGRVTSQVVDCGQRDALFSWAEAVNADTNRLDALFNNAGVGYGARFADSSEENFEWLIDINFWGVVHATRAFLPLLTQAERGHLVNLSSIFGMVGIPTQSAVSAKRFRRSTWTRICLCRAFIPVACRPILRGLPAPTAAATAAWSWPMRMRGTYISGALPKPHPSALRTSSCGALPAVNGGSWSAGMRG